MNWTDNPSYGQDFSRVRVVVEGILDDRELNQAHGCVAYAFREHLRGEDFGDIENVSRADGYTSFECYYDSTKCRGHDVGEALLSACNYVEFGTPIRKTDRQGRGTAGTRLVSGIGQGASVFVDAPELIPYKYAVAINGTRVREFTVEASPTDHISIHRVL